MTEPARLLYSAACRHLAKVSVIIDNLVQMKISQAPAAVPHETSLDEAAPTLQ